MKIPGIPVHILTESSLRKERLKTEKSTRAITNKQIENLLYDNSILRLTITDIQRKCKKIGL